MGSTFGYMNIEREVFIPCKYYSISEFYSNRAYAKIKNDRYEMEGFINRSGEFVIIKEEEPNY